MLSVVPREILTHILESCEKLKDVKNFCEAEDIILSEDELHSLSRKFKLPFYNEERLASGTKNRGLSYLLRCKRLGVRELVLEFLDGDDPRVLEYFSVSIVSTHLFPYYKAYSCSKKTPDCPVTVAELLKLEEWNTLFEAMTVRYPEYPLPSCVENNSLEMIKVLVEDGRTVLKNASLEAAVLMERLQIVEFLLSKSPPNTNWHSIISRAHNAKNRAIFNLFLLDKSGNTCDWDKLFLDSVEKGDLERIRSMVEHEKVYSILCGDEPLQAATGENQVEVIQFLLSRPETTDQSIEIAFSRVVHSKSVEAVDILLLSGRVNKEKVRILRDDLSRTSKVILHKTLDNYFSV